MMKFASHASHESCVRLAQLAHARAVSAARHAGRSPLIDPTPAEIARAVGFDLVPVKGMGKMPIFDQSRIAFGAELTGYRRDQAILYGVAWGLFVRDGRHPDEEEILELAHLLALPSDDAAAPLLRVVGA